MQIHRPGKIVFALEVICPGCCNLGLILLLQLTQAPFLLFFGAVAISAWYGGRGPGIVATLLSAVFANYFFQYPQYSWSLNLVSVLRMALFILEGVLVSLLVGALRTTQAQARKNFDRLKASEAEIRDLNQALQRQVDKLQTKRLTQPVTL